eukprot:Hpha_TRINITY_DN4311_c0_g1::TRINITY_DN4311_c0_g1_i1::g.50002::m.50002
MLRTLAGVAGGAAAGYMVGVGGGDVIFNRKPDFFGGSVVERALCDADHLIRAQRRFPGQSCILATRTREGVSGRPVNPLSIDLRFGDGASPPAPEAIFHTRRACRKVEELRESPHCCLVFTDPMRVSYVKLQGKAEVLSPGEAVRKWEPSLRMFYPQGHENGEGSFIAYRLAVEKLEFYSAVNEDWR